MVKKKEYVSFVVYLKGGGYLTFQKIVPSKKQSNVFLKEITDMLLSGKHNKECVVLETDNVKESRGRIIEYKGKVVIDGSEIAAINSCY